MLQTPLRPSSTVTPRDIVTSLVTAGERKAQTPSPTLFVRALGAGTLLAMATTLALEISAQAGHPFAGACFFPVGFVMLVILGLELLTGNFLLLPLALLQRRASVRALLRNWLVVAAGNLCGSLLYAFLYVYMGAGKPHVLETLKALAEAKTVSYAASGFTGWLSLMSRAILCNWLVTMGVVLSFASRATPGKIMAMWLPIFSFFALGFEHSVVNMFVIPAGIWSGADVSYADWWLINQIPVTLGNLLGACLLTAIPVSMGHLHRPNTVPNATRHGTRRLEQESHAEAGFAGV